MTVTTDDLRAAVGAGRISEAQAASLLSLANTRQTARDNTARIDEPFELFRGFNEVFIIVGLAILAFGWAGLTTMWVGGNGGGFMDRTIWAAIAGAAIVWALSEYFVAHRRMVGPAIALSLFFAANASIGFSAGWSQPFMVAQDDYSSLPVPVGLTVLALVVYWLRFRVPFVMAMIALGAFGLALLIAANSSGTPSSVAELFLLSGDGPFAWITLGIGIIVFIAAMLFDMSDPHRISLRAQNGFWLHLIAAPALVNTLALSLFEDLTPTNMILLVGFLGLIALIAIVIDRRSFLIAAVGYSVALAVTVIEDNSVPVLILALGVCLLLLGAFWERVRAAVLNLLPNFVPLHRLPPTA